MKKIAAALIAANLFTVTGVDASEHCNTEVSNLSSEVSGNTDIRLGISGDYVIVCNTNSAWKNVSPALCATWITYLRSAVARKANMIIYYADDVKCASLPGYSLAPAPGYMMLVD